MAVNKWKNAWEELESYIEATDKHLSTQKGKAKDKELIVDMKVLMQGLKDKHIVPSPTPKAKTSAAPSKKRSTSPTTKKPRARKRKSKLTKGVDKMMEFLGLV